MNQLPSMVKEGSMDFIVLKREIPVYWHETADFLWKYRNSFNFQLVSERINAKCHARDDNGRPTYKKEAYEEIISRVREKCPDIIICASTSGRINPDIGQRAEVLDLRPEMASLTVGSLNFPADTSINSI